MKQMQKFYFDEGYEMGICSQIGQKGIKIINNRLHITGYILRLDKTTRGIL